MKEELEKRELMQKVGSFTVPFLVGGLVGAGIALLFAPKSGREAREGIKDLAMKTKENVTSTIHKGRELYEENTTALSGAIEAGKAAYRDEIERHRKAA